LHPALGVKLEAAMLARLYADIRRQKILPGRAGDCYSDGHD
jgi:hypothetical protein